MRLSFSVASVSLALLAIPVGQACADGMEPVGTGAMDGDVALRGSQIGFKGSVDLLRLNAKELVYNTDGSKLSELDWVSKAVAVSAEFENEVTDRITVFASGSLGIGADSHMTDYDWLSSTTSLWTDRSVHPDTRLDHYYSADFHARLDLLKSGGFAMGPTAGVKITDVQWTSYGGDYIYSVNSFRDTVGSFDPAEKTITYGQTIPAAYGGLAAVFKQGRFDLSASVRGGLSFHPSDTDNHWLRALLFTDQFSTAAYAGASIAGSYKFTDRFSASLGFDFDRYFEANGDTRVTDTTTGNLLVTAQNVAGISRQDGRLSAAVAYRF